MASSPHTTLAAKRESLARFPAKREFPTLDLARKSAEIHGGRLPIWARDISSDGKKVFSAHSYQEFLFYARTCALPSKCYYEVLSSPDDHCDGETDAFFDNELYKESNPDFNPTIFRKLFGDAVHKYVISTGLPAPICFWAFSCTIRKYSSHVRVHIPGYAFAGPESIGLFFHAFDVSNFMCNTSKGPKPIIDYSVYSRNRVFRPPYASKLEDPSRIMVPEQENMPYMSGWIRDENAFLNMLLQREACLATTLIDLRTATPLELEELTGFATGQPNNLHQPKSSATHLMDAGVGPGSDEYHALIVRLEEHISNTMPWVGTTLQENGLSPNLSCIYFRSDSRNCILAERKHRSNHVRFRVLLYSVPCFQQGCHDLSPPCDKLSNSFPLPLDIHRLINDWRAARSSSTSHPPTPYHGECLF